MGDTEDSQTAQLEKLEAGSAEEKSPILPTPSDHGITDELVQRFVTRLLGEGFTSTGYRYWPLETLGEGYTTQRKVLEVDCVLAADKNPTKPDGMKQVLFVVKIPPPFLPADRLDAMRTFGVYAKEVKMYKDVVEHFRQLIEGSGKECHLPFAKFVYGRTVKGGVVADDDGKQLENTALKEMLVLEKLEGYEVIDKKAGLDLEHIRLLMPALGRFHAVGFVINKFYNKQAEELDEMKTALPDSFRPFIEALFEGFAAVLEYHGRFQEAEGLKKVATLKNFEAGWDKAHSRDHQLTCLLHGDLWCSNMMFRYREDPEGSRHPVEMRFVDLQMSQFGDPATDINYMLMSSTRRQLRQNHMDQMLDWYVSAFRQQLDDLNHDPDQLVPWLDRQYMLDLLKKGSVVGLMRASNMVQMILATPEDLKIITSNISVDEAIKFYKQRTERWRREGCHKELNDRLLELIDDVHEAGFL